MSIDALARYFKAGETPRREFKAPDLPPGVVPAGHTAAIAMDSGGAFPFLNAQAAGGGFGCGLGFPGYSYLSELAQRSEYRAPNETTADEMTREWIKFTGASESELQELEDAFEEFGVQAVARQSVLTDGYMGRAQIYISIKGQDDPGKRDKPLLLEDASGLLGKLQGFKPIEPIWSTPQAYNSNDPTKPDFYKPDSWYVMGINTHSDRLLTLISRPLPDILKPAYNFSGMSASQLIEPYVVRWLKTVDSVNRLISNFSTRVIMTDIGSQLQGDGGKLLRRLQLMAMTSDNRGILALNKATEQFVLQNTPLGGLADLQQQALEHMAYPTHIPLIKLTGSSPAGLNASGEGEIKVWYDHVSSQQQVVLRAPVTTMLKVVQLHLWGKINPKIGFEFVPLDTPTDKELSEKRKADGATDTAYVNAAIVSPDEVRERLRTDPTSGYTGLKGDAPAPPEEATHELGEESADNATERAKELATHTAKLDKSTAKDEGEGVRIAQDAWNESQHPRGAGGQFGPGEERAGMFKAASAKRQELDDALSEANAGLGEFEQYRAAGSATLGGLLPDAVKASAEYKAAKGKYDTAFSALRNFNARFVPHFKKELAAERDARRAAKLKRIQS